jgi:hypothetical protein
MADRHSPEQKHSCASLFIGQFNSFRIRGAVVQPGVYPIVGRIVLAFLLLLRLNGRSLVMKIRSSSLASTLASTLARMRRLPATVAAWALTLAMLFVLSGCVLPFPPSGQVDTLPPGTVLDEPVIAVAPNAVASGDFVSVSGAGWPANETVYVNVESPLSR